MSTGLAYYVWESMTCHSRFYRLNGRSHCTSFRVSHQSTVLDGSYGVTNPTTSERAILTVLRPFTVY